VKKFWLPLTSVILSMLPAVFMFANPGDKNTNGRQKINARKGTKATPKSTAGKVVGSADKDRTTRRIPDGDPDRPGKVLESPKSTDKAGTGRKNW
jgi:hypothetical protein